MPVAAPPANPVHANVAFVRVAQFQSLPAAEQATAKEALESRVLAAIGGLATDERIVLDAEDGLALVIFGDPERALDVAQQVFNLANELPLHVGVNYGPLALIARGPDARVIGDGLSAAGAASRFATPERLMVTEDFAKALRAASPDRAFELVSAGDFTDTRVRQHRFLTPDPERRVMRKRRLATFAAGGAIIILLLGVLGRDIYQPMFKTRPAIVKLEVKPRGEVFIDGESKGRVPPLTELLVPPGTRKIRIVQAGYRPYEATLDLKPGQRLTVTHTMARIPPPEKPKGDFWRDLKKKFGS